MEGKTLLTMLDYEEGFHAAAVGVPLDPDASAMWQAGWHDGHKVVTADDEETVL